MSILSSARNAKNVSLAEEIFHRIENNFSNNESGLTSARILLANTYSLSGNHSMSLSIRNKLNQSNTKKLVGYSWTVINEKVYVKLKQFKYNFIVFFNRNLAHMIDQIHII